jgi:hypothetical protein
MLLTFELQYDYLIISTSCIQVKVNISRQSKFIFLFYCLILLWGSSFYFLKIKETEANYWYQFAFGLIPLVGGILGIVKAKAWGFFRSFVGRAIFFLSAGLTSWGIGQMFWSVYYNLILRVEIPYPSLADVGYILAIPLWALGIVNLSKATGARFSVKHLRGQILLLTIPIGAIILSYYLLFVLARGGSIPVDGDGVKLFFDFAYPLGDLVILTLSLLVYGLSFTYLGGKYKIPIICIIFGFIIMYLADFSFSFVTTNMTYYNGHWVDILFPTAMVFMAIGINSFDTKSHK